MFNKIKNLWNNYGFEIILIISVSVIIILGITRIGKKGKYKRPSKAGINYYLKQIKGQKPKIRLLKKGPPKQSEGELECRRVLEQIFGRRFPNIRPNFLRNEVTGNIHNLELDCYNSELKLAVEYNGKQHYQYLPYFHKSKAVFQNQLYRDYMKKNKCKENGVCLINVPYTVKNCDIKNFLIKKLRQNKYIN